MSNGQCPEYDDVQKYTSPRMGAYTSEVHRLLLLAVPFSGWPVIRPVFLYCLDTLLVKPLFEEMARWGAFTSIDFKTDQDIFLIKSKL